MRASPILPVFALIGIFSKAPIATGGADTMDNTPKTSDPAPDLGPNVRIFDAAMDMARIQAEIDAIADAQDLRDNEFGPHRYALLFKPGSYDVNIRCGYYTQAAGLGRLPGQVRINGAVESREVRATSLSNFWRAAENLTVTPTGGTNFWVVSQAAPLRRVHIKGDLSLFKAGYTSGGFLADCRVDGSVTSGTQQQWFSRNTRWRRWDGGAWNMFFMGVDNPPAGTWPDQPYTTIEATPVLREKPFLHLDDAGAYQVFVPALRRNAKGISWEGGDDPGISIPIDRFHIARPGIDDAASLNAALAAGRNLLFTPGIYELGTSLVVSRAGTLVLGLGYPSLMPTAGTPALTLADEGGIIVAGLTLDAGPVTSEALLLAGPPGSSADHSADPTFLMDVYCRVGTGRVGSAASCLTINSHDVVADHVWLWRADHGPSATRGRPGWTVNESANGLVVNGDDVTFYGLFNEHFQKHQTLWNGERGRTYFYQSELPYDAPDQASWSHDGSDGYASYKVADGVTAHEAWGLGIYNYFVDAPVWCDNAVEVPDASGVKMRHLRTRYLSGAGGGIRHVINGAGPAAEDAGRDAIVVEYPDPAGLPGGKR